MTGSAAPPADGRTSSESDEGAEISRERPAEDSADVQSASRAEEAREQAEI